jgi:hypothetical protein
VKEVKKFISVVIVLVAISAVIFCIFCIWRNAGDNTVKQVLSNKIIEISAFGIIQSKDSKSITIKDSSDPTAIITLNLADNVKVEKWFMKSSTGTVKTYTVQKGSIEELKEGDKVHAYLNPSLEVRYIIVFY